MGNQKPHPMLRLAESIACLIGGALLMAFSFRHQTPGYYFISVLVIFCGIFALLLFFFEGGIKTLGRPVKKPGVSKTVVQERQATPDLGKNRAARRPDK